MSTRPAPNHSTSTRAARAQQQALLRAAAEIRRILDMARVEQGLSKAELARRYGVRQSTLTRILHGRTGPPELRTIAGLADTLGLHVEIVIRAQPTNPPRRRAPVEVRWSGE